MPDGQIRAKGFDLTGDAIKLPLTERVHPAFIELVFTDQFGGKHAMTIYRQEQVSHVRGTRIITAACGQYRREEHRRVDQLPLTIINIVFWHQILWILR